MGRRWGGGVVVVVGLGAVVVRVCRGFAVDRSREAGGRVPGTSSSTAVLPAAPLLPVRPDPYDLDKLFGCEQDDSDAGRPVVLGPPRGDRWWLMAGWRGVTVGVLVLALLAACGGPAGGPPAEGSVLRIVVEGLPEGVPGNVTVAGPNGFAVRVAGSATFGDLVPGDYEVVAFGVATAAAGFAPEATSQRVAVTDAGGGTATVRYAELPVIVPSRSRPVDAETASLLVGAAASGLGALSVTASTAETGGVLQFATSSPYLDALEPGHVVTLGVTPFTPLGFIGTVREIDRTGDQVVVAADPAALDDAIEQGVVAYSASLQTSSVVASRAHVAGLAANGIGRSSDDREFCPIDTAVDLLRGEAGTLILDGSLCFTLDVDLDVTIRLGSSPSLSFITAVSERAAITLTGSAELPTFSRSFKLIDYYLAPVTIVVGVVPVVIAPVITVSVNASGGLVASFSTAVEQSISMRAGLELEDGVWRQIAPTVSPVFRYTPVTFDAGLNARAGVAPQLALRLYGAVGPTLRMNASARADVAPLRNPAWRLYFGFTVAAGVEFTVLRVIDVRFTAELFEWEWLVAQAPAAPGPGDIAIALEPMRVDLAAGASTSFTATVTGTADDRVTWSASCGTLPSSGTRVTYVAPMVAGTCTVAARSVAAPAVQAVATVVVAAPPSTVAVTVSPSTATLAPSASTGFTSSVTGTTDTRVTWTATCGTVVPAGASATYTAPNAGPLTCEVRATSVADPARFASATVTVIDATPPPWRFQPAYLTFSGDVGGGAPPLQTVTVHNDATTARTFALSAPDGVSLSPSTGTIGAGGSMAVAVGVPACAPDDAGTTTTWLVQETQTGHGGSATVGRSCGAVATGMIQVDIQGLPPGANGNVAISGQGLTYRPVETVLIPDVPVGSYTMTAAAVVHGGVTYDPTPVGAPVAVTAGAVATVSVAYAAPASVAVSISPASVTMAAGASHAFTATVSGTTNVGVAWSPSCGTIAGTGSTVTYLAPTTGTTCTVTATSLADPTRFAVATVTVLPPTVSVTITPSSVTLEPYATQQFTATVTGATNPSVTWSTSSPSCGHVTTAGLYTAPPSPMACSVTARSVQDPSRSATASVAVGWAGEPVWRAEPTSVLVAGVVGGGPPAPVEFRLYNDGGSPGTFALTTSGFASATPTTGTVGVAAYQLISVTTTACSAVGASEAYVDVSGGGSFTSVRVSRVCEAANVPAPVTRVPAAGYDHSLAVTATGLVHAWGRNANGQLGDGTTSTRNTSAVVSGPVSVLAVAAGDHSLAMTSAGRLWSWGRNTYGQLGDGTTSPRTTAVLLTTVQDVVAIAAGAQFSLALTSDGRVWSWGAGASGQLGHGTTQNRSTPTAIPGLVNVVAIAAGELHALALLGNGEVWAWGRNADGQLGDGTTVSERRSPVRVGPLTNVVAIAAGGSHSLAVDGSGRLWAWGANVSGQLGLGSTAMSSTPVEVVLPHAVASVAAGFGHSLARTSGGAVYAWGRNDTGQVGDGTLAMRTSPVEVAGLASVVAVAAGWGHSIAVRTDGTVWLWGQNGSGQIGDGTWTMRRNPVVGPVGGLLMP